MLNKMILKKKNNKFNENILNMLTHANFISLKFVPHNQTACCKHATAHTSNDHDYFIN